MINSKKNNEDYNIKYQSIINNKNNISMFNNNISKKING